MIKTRKMKNPHILAIACPAQGHVMPFLQLCNRIAAQGIKVTFVNTEFVHSRITAASMTEKEREENDNGVRLVSVPDGLYDLNDRADPAKGFEGLKRVMPGHVMDLILEINRSHDDLPITAIVADLTVGWILDVAEKIGAQQFGFWSSGPSSLAFFQSLGLNNGVVTNNNSENQPNLLPKEMIGLGNKNDQEKMQNVFLDIAVTSLQTTNRVKCTLGNVFYELDSISCDQVPKFLPVGPLSNNSLEGSSSNSGSFLPEDSSCINWLNNQPPGSVIYVAFGSTTVLNKKQLKQLIEALEQSGRPFLWVYGAQIGRESAFLDIPKGFLERVSSRGKIVEWTSQDKVLAHSSVACFLTHCGWNSAVESVSHGVPLLCLPYFADHFLVQSHICDSWKVGLRLDPDENGIRSSKEILGKIELLLSNANFKINALKLKDLAQKSNSKGGHSFENMQNFIKLLMN